MCFSATASFAASAALGGIAAASAATPVKKTDKPLIWIPVVFAIQQFCEGVIWLSFGSAFINELASKVFLLFAFAWWPALIPWAFWYADPSEKHRKRMRWFIWIGWLTAIYGLAIVMMLPTQTQIVCSSIRYDVSAYIPWGGIPYLAATVGSGLASSVRAFRWFSGLLFGFILMTWALWIYATVSVWCFFGAWLSVIIFQYLREQTRSSSRVLRSTSL